MSRNSELEDNYLLGIQRRGLLSVLPPLLNLQASMFFVGFCIAYISVYDTKALFNYYHHPNPETSQWLLGFVNSCIFLTGAFGALLSSFLLQKFSRRQTLLILNAVAVVGLVLLFLGRDITFLILGRCVQGIAMGGLSSVAPLINKELSPTSLSSVTGVFNQLFIVLGIISTNVYHAFLSKPDAEPSFSALLLAFGWIYVVMAVQTVLLLGPFAFETPKYLLEQGSTHECKELLERFYLPSSVAAVLKEKQKDLQAVNSKQTDEGGTDEGYSRRVRVALLLPLAQQLTGINILVVYINPIFASVSEFMRTYIGTIANCMQLLGALCTTMLASRFGRKSILVTGLAVIIVANVLLGAGFLGKPDQNSLQPQPFWSELCCVGGSLLFLAAFGSSAGPIVWQYIPEIVPGKIVGVATLLNWGTSFLIVFLYPTVGKQFGSGPVFLVLAGVILLMELYLFVSMKETKDLTEAEINESYQP